MTSTTITSKWQVTIPEEVRRELPELQIGGRIRWEILSGVLTAKPVRSIDELAGCLKSDGEPRRSAAREKAAIAAARLKHYSRKYGKR